MLSLQLSAGEHDILLNYTTQKDAPEFANMQLMAVIAYKSIALGSLKVRKFDK